MRSETVASLFDQHAEDLFAFLVYRVGNRAVAEDLVADTFERVLRNRTRFNATRGSEKRWIYSIALNLARDQARRGVVERRVTEQVATEASSGTSHSPLDAVDDRDELKQALLGLSEPELEVIALRFGGDLTLKEIARVLDQGESAVEGRLYRGLGKLREQLDG